MLAAFGHSPTLAARDFSGEARFTPETFQEAYLLIRIKAASLSVTDDISDKDRREMERTMNEEVLETSRYPEIVYESKKIAASNAGDGRFSVKLAGELQMHGVTSSQSLALQAVFIGGTLRAHGEFTVRLSTYGIKPPSAIGGTLKVKDELKCSFDVLARKDERS